MNIKSNSFFYVFSIRFVILFFSFFEMTHLNLQGIDFLMPNTILMSIFFWGIYDENIIKPHYLLFISLLNEILREELLGITTVLYLFFSYFIINQKRFFVNKPFLVSWFGFLMFSATIYLTKIILLNIFYKSILFKEYWTIHLLLTVLLYPIMHIIYSYLRLIPKRY